MYRCYRFCCIIVTIFVVLLFPFSLHCDYRFCCISNFLLQNKQLIGHAYENMINYDSAYIYYSKSLEYYINSNSISGLSACFNRICN